MDSWLNLDSARHRSAHLGRLVGDFAAVFVEMVTSSHTFGLCSCHALSRLR